MGARLHAVVGLDSEEARIFRFTSDDVEKEQVRADMDRQIVHRARSPGASPLRDDREYFEAILAELT